LIIIYYQAAEPTVPCEAKPLSSGDGQVATSWVMAGMILHRYNINLAS